MSGLGCHIHICTLICFEYVLIYKKTHLQTCGNACTHTHINRRSAGSRIAASLHQGLNINVRGQISSRGNPFKSMLLPGWCSWLIYANLYAQIMQMMFQLEPLCVECVDGLNQFDCVCAFVFVSDIWRNVSISFQFVFSVYYLIFL